MKKISGDKVFLIFNNVLAALFLLIAFYPLYYVVIASFSEFTQVMKGNVWIVPVDFTLAGYEMMLEQEEIWTGYANAIFYTILGTLIQLVVNIPLAYALSRPGIPFRSAINKFFMFAMFFSGGLIPTYLWVSKLDLVGSFWPLVLLPAVNVYNMIICRTFFQSSIPGEIIEAAKIDGCDDAKTFGRVVLPLSKPILAVMVLYFGVAHWNSYFNAMIYLRDEKHYPLQLVLRHLLNTTKLSDEAMDMITREDLQVLSMRFGVIIVASVPMLLLYPFIQKHFVKGVMIGAVKG